MACPFIAAASPFIVEFHWLFFSTFLQPTINQSGSHKMKLHKRMDRGKREVKEREGVDIPAGCPTKI